MTIVVETRCRNSPLGSKQHQLVSWLLLITILNMMVVLMRMMMRRRCGIKMMMMTKVFPMMTLIMLMLLPLMILKAKLLCHQINCHKLGKLLLLSIVALVQLFLRNYVKSVPPV